MIKRKAGAILGGMLAAVVVAGNVANVGVVKAYAESSKYNDGNFTGSSHVEFHDKTVDYDMYVTVSVKDGVISKVALNDAKNADIEQVNIPYLKYAMNAMADKYVGTTGEAVDVVSGATFSSAAINDAVSKAMAKSEANTPDEDVPDNGNTDNGNTGDNNNSSSDNTGDTNQDTDNTGVLEGVLTTGAYELTADSYDASAQMKLPMYICINKEEKTFVIHPYKNGVVDYATDKGSGSLSYDKETGVYTMKYEAGVTVVALGSTTTFTTDGDTITFTSPVRYGMAWMNTRDEADNFLSYTAKKSSYAGELKSGAYVLTADSYDAGAQMKMPAYIGIDVENKTFEVHPYKNNVVDKDTNKGAGTISFNQLTGSYVMTYTSGVTVVALGSTSTFTVSEDGITFTSPLRYGAAQMNTTDEAGNFLSYTAKLLDENVTPDVPADDNTSDGDDSKADDGKADDTTEAPAGSDTTAADSSAATDSISAAQSESTADSTVKTGDYSNQFAYVLAVLVSGVAVTVLTVRRKRA